MTITSELLPCPFCGQQDAFVEQLDSDASVVICQGRIDEHSACLARGPVAVQQSEDEDQPGFDEAIREWNNRVALAQQPAPATVPDAAKVIDALEEAYAADGALDFMRDAAAMLRQQIAAAPAAPVAVQDPVAHRLINCLGEVITEWRDGPPPKRITSACGVEQTDVSVELAYTAPPAAEQPDHSGDAAHMVHCACGDAYPSTSYGAGFIDGSGMCPNCDAEIPARDIPATPAAEQPDAVRVPVETLRRIHRDLDACQKVIWLAGCRPRGYGFDPAYVTDAQARLKEIDALLAGGEV